MGEMADEHLDRFGQYECPICHGMNGDHEYFCHEDQFTGITKDKYKKLMAVVEAATNILTSGNFIHEDKTIGDLETALKALEELDQ